MIKVVNTLLSPTKQQEVNEFLKEKTWEFGWKSNRKVDVYSFLHKHYAGHRKVNDSEDAPYDCAEELKQQAPLLYEFWKFLLQSVLIGHTLIRCYANGISYGSDGTIHVDARDENNFTSLYYPHFSWDPNWGGETIFYTNDKTDIIQTVFPKPNRLLIFDGRIPHRAAGVSRTCPELRITLMFKTRYIDKKQIDFLVSVGAKEVEHSGRKLFDHLKSTYDILKTWNAPEHVCLAGLFHSIYGTEYFKHACVSIDERDLVRDLIGEKAEQLAYEFCTIPRNELEGQELLAIAKANDLEQRGHHANGVRTKQ